MIIPVQPQSRAVPMARAARLAAPRAEAAFPPRSLVAAITGADSGVLISRPARSGPSPAAISLDLRVPEPRALLLVPVDAFLHRVDVDEGEGSRAGQQRRFRASSARNSRRAFSSWLTLPQV